LKVDAEICLHCGACVGLCPVNAITLHDTHIEINDDCIECGQCVKGCPVGAMSADE